MPNKYFKIAIISTLLLVVSVLNVQTVSAQKPGAIWTTTGSCGDPQNVNHYSTGDDVHINGAGVDPGQNSWTITGQPGGASNHPGIVVASGNYTVGASGAFCFLAYTIGPDDGGEYRVVFGGKNDNYRVKQVVVPTQPTPTQPTPTQPTPTQPTPTQPTPVTQSTPAPVIAPATGSPTGPGTLIAVASSALGLSGISLGVWLKRRKM